MMLGFDMVFLFEKIIISDLFGLNSIFQVLAQVSRVSRSSLSRFSSSAWFSKVFKSVTSSAKSDMSLFMLSSISYK